MSFSTCSPSRIRIESLGSNISESVHRLFSVLEVFTQPRPKEDVIYCGKRLFSERPHTEYRRRRRIDVNV